MPIKQIERKTAVPRACCDFCNNMHKPERGGLIRETVEGARDEALFDRWTFKTFGTGEEICVCNKDECRKWLEELDAIQAVQIVKSQNENSIRDACMRIRDYSHEIESLMFEGEKSTDYITVDGVRKDLQIELSRLRSELIKADFPEVKSENTL